MPGRPPTSTALRTEPPSVPGCPDAVARTVALPLRVPVFVVVSSALAIAAHGIVEGAVPAPALAALAVVAVAAGAWAGLGTRRSGPALAALLAGTQLAAHAVLALCHCTATSTVGRVVHTWLCPSDLTPEQSRWAADPLLIATPAHGAEGYLAHLVPGRGMLVLHVVAAALVAFWLACGEDAVWRAARQVWSALVFVLVLLPVAAPASRTTARGARRAVRRLTAQVDGARTNPRRGPPAVPVLV